MSFKTELHCHSSVVSFCGRITPAEIVERYLANGYTSLVLTEHINHPAFYPPHCPCGEGAEERAEFFYGSYQKLCEAAEGKLHILLGAELCFDRSGTDYLIYGVEKEHLPMLISMLDGNLEDISRRVREAGLLFVQAHPFRNNIKVTDPNLLDGVEVYNGHPFIACRNDFAALWAKKFNLIATSGTDTHHNDRLINGGIVTDEPITSNEQLLAVLRSRSYRLLENGESVPLP